MLSCVFVHACVRSRVALGECQLRERDGKSVADMAFEAGSDGVLELLHLK